MRHAGIQDIETPRLLLRRLLPEDAPQMYANWASDPEVTRYLRWEPHKSPAETRELLAAWALLYPNPDGSYPDGTSVAAAPQSQTQTQTGTGSASAPSSGARVKSGIIANFRSGPGSEYGVIAELEPGTPVKIISVAGNWYFCEVNGLQGYLHPSCVVGF